MRDYHQARRDEQTEVADGKKLASVCTVIDAAQAINILIVSTL